jgi:lipid-binding SYLF domain-containing protein
LVDVEGNLRGCRAKFQEGCWGLQIGGQSTDLVLVATNDEGMQSLLKSKFKIGADAAAAAGPVGRNTAADTNLYLKSELLTYSRSKGLFAGIDLTGTIVHQNTDATREFYGHDVSFEDVLRGHLTIPSAARHFVNTVAKYFRRTTR